MKQYRQRRRKASDSGRVAFEVKIASGFARARTTPNSGIVIWCSDKTSSKYASNSSSARSISSISKTGFCGWRIARNNGRSIRFASENSGSPSPSPASRMRIESNCF